MNKIVDMVATVLVVSLLSLLLVGCSTKPTLQTVNVPISIPCDAETPTRPTMPTEAISPTTPDANLIDTWVRAAMAEIVLREAYEKRLREELQSCL